MRWLSNLRRKRDRDHDLDREIAFHIDALTRDYEAAGMSPEKARTVFGISPLTDHISDSLAENRLRTAVLTFFAGTAISLACLGLYGTLSYLGRMRRREMGLRLAIGASRTQIVAALVAQGLRIVAIGCVAGLAMGLAASRLLQGMLYAVQPTDLETYAAIVLLVIVVAVIASVGPALRAATTDPAEVLREE